MIIGIVGTHTQQKEKLIYFYFVLILKKTLRVEGMDGSFIYFFELNLYAFLAFSFAHYEIKPKNFHLGVYNEWSK